MAGKINYEKKSVQAVRGTEGRLVSKLAKDGWELVDQEVGRLRVTLTFRRQKKPLNMLLVGGAVAALLLLAAAAGIGAALKGGEGKTDGKEPVPAAVSTTALPAEESTKAPTKTSVDKLLDRLNGPDMGGVRTGDRFLVVGEMYEEDAWGVGASGDYAVYLKAKDGTDDLLVLLKDEGQAEALANGTEVEMLLEASEVTIDGNESGGWMRAVSVKVL